MKKPKDTPIPKPSAGRVFIAHADPDTICVCCGRETVAASRRYVRVDRMYQHLAPADADYDVAPIGPHYAASSNVDHAARHRGGQAGEIVSCGLGRAGHPAPDGRLVHAQLGRQLAAADRQRLQL